MWLQLVKKKKAISKRLKNNETIVSKYCTLILITEGLLHFKDKDQFANEALDDLIYENLWKYDIIYEKTLKSSGFNGSIRDLLQQ